MKLKLSALRLTLLLLLFLLQIFSSTTVVRSVDNYFARFATIYALLVVYRMRQMRIEYEK